MTKIFMFPGQGSQHVGMGKELFEIFPEFVDEACALLGYSLPELCLEDKDKKLSLTQYTQPALYAINALSYLKQMEDNSYKPNFVAGHSLGEYNALFASGAFDFITGLKLVQKRGELMGEVSGSSMAAVVGLSVQKIQQILKQEFSTLEIANLNAREQIVIAGSSEEINQAKDIFKKADGRYVVLNVSAAFHSSYMLQVKEKFANFIGNFSFESLSIPVISNFTALPYKESEITQNLMEQITGSVRWYESIEYLLQQPDPQFEEIGPKTVLTNLLVKIKKEYTPSSAEIKNEQSPSPTQKTYLPIAKNEKNIVFMYSGQGTQYYHMGKELYDNNKIFRESMNYCDEIAKNILGISLVELLYKERQNRFEEFSTTSYTHPAIFMFGYSLTQVILDWGIEPDYVLGYSLGEYVANVIAGCISVEDGLKVAIEQGILIEKHTPPATILAVLASPDILQENPQVFVNGWMAGQNFTKNFTFTLENNNCAQVENFLKEQKISYQKLPISRGFHSPLIDSAEENFKRFADKLNFSLPQKRIISPALGSDIKVIDSNYLWNVVRCPVHLTETLDILENRSPKNIYIDIGPAGSMATAVKYHCSSTINAPVITINAFGKNLQSLEKAKSTILSY